MQLLPSTILALATIAVMLVQGPRRGLWAFLALTPFGAAAAFNLPALGGASIGQEDLAICAVFALTALSPGGPDRLAGTLRPGQPGFWLLLLFGWAAVSALFLPRLFAGETQVFAISRAANAEGIVALDLRPTTGNITQLFRFSLVALAFLSFATLFRTMPDSRAVLRGLAVATGVHVALGWIDVAFHAAGLQALLEPIRTANYAILADHYMLGMKRMVGGFPEASAFGKVSVAFFAFWFQLWLLRPSRGAFWLMVLSLLAVLRSTSSGAYVALVVFLLLYGAWLALGGMRARVSRQALGAVFGAVMAIWLAALAIFAAYELADPFTAFLDRTIFDKLGSQSGVERMSWNAQAFHNFTETWGLGAGLGSVRASNWLLATLGSLGAVGTALYLAFLVSLLRMPLGRAEPGTAAVAQSLKAAGVALFLSALLTAATPNLGMLFFALAGLAAGLARGGQLAGRRAAAESGALA